MKAVRSKNTEIVERLVAQGAKVSAVDKVRATFYRYRCNGLCKMCKKNLTKDCILCDKHMYGIYCLPNSADRVKTPPNVL